MPLYRWKHGWIPLTHTAAMSKSKGDRQLAVAYLARAKEAGAPTRNVDRWIDGVDKSPGVAVERTPKGRLKVTSPYDREFVAEVKAMDGRWSPATKTWSVPGDRGDDLDRLLDRTYGTKPVTVDVNDLPTDVSVRVVDRTIRVQSPYSNEFREDAKRLGGRWNGRDREWSIPAKHRDELMTSLRKNFRDTPKPDKPDKPQPRSHDRYPATAATDFQVKTATKLLVERLRDGNDAGFMSTRKFIRDGIVDRAALRRLSSSEISLLISSLREDY